MLGFFRKRKKTRSAVSINAYVEACYNEEKEKRKSQNLSDHLATTLSLAEEENCWVFIKKILLETMPTYPLGHLEKMAHRDRFAYIQSDVNRGFFNFIGEDERAALTRVSQYGQMVTYFPEGMVEMAQGEFLYELFEKARHTRLLAYHLYQFVSDLENESTICLRSGFEKMTKLLVSGDEETKKLAKLSPKELLELVGSLKLKGPLADLSLELAEILVARLDQTALHLKTVLNDQTLQHEPLDFEKESGLGALSKKIANLGIIAGSLNERDLKKMLIRYIKR